MSSFHHHCQIGTMMTDAIHIVLRGQPKAWKRPQYNRKTGGFYTAADDDFFHGLLRSEAARVMDNRAPIDGAIELSLLAVFQIPRSWSKKKQALAQAGLLFHTSRPDLDNLVKGVKDSLSRVVYRDDALIASYGACSKLYGVQPRIEISFAVIQWAGDRMVGKPLAAQPDLFNPGAPA